MYANLLVRANNKAMYAYDVRITGPHAVEVYLDDPESESNYAEPAGHITLDPDQEGEIRITASF